MNEDQNQEAKPIELEIAPIESITKAEIDVQISTARQFPRSLAQFLKRAEAMVTVDQETAESCFYQLRRRDKRTGETKIIEGESIRMAEIVAANFGNLRSAVHIVGHTPLRVSVRAVCHDLETNNLIAVEKQAKTAYSDGSPYNEDMAITTANALVSKALRDAIFRVVPRALIKPLKEKAKLVAFGQGAAFVERRKKAVAWATDTRKVPLDRVLAVLGVKGIDDITIDHLEILSGLKNALMEGDTTIDEAFPPLEDATPSKANFVHPEKAKQEAKDAKQEAPKETVKKTEQKKETAPVKTEAKVETPTAIGAETTPVPTVTNTLAAQQQTTPGPASAPEPKPEPTPAPAVETPVPAQEAAEPVALTEAQAKFKALVEEGGYTFDDMLGWGKVGFPNFKKTPPASWSAIPEDTAKFLCLQIKGVLAGIKLTNGKK